ncbi:MAG: hypothetical protein A2Y40_07105 [Candidatus Margulisbacteria bacterium GWF2_35_9]|nr:MAG: hypothetical protein A2Y40_07105 [Candidatus Margulisbacteria bacterium GWF2_35_9]
MMKNKIVSPSRKRNDHYYYRKFPSFSDEELTNISKGLTADGLCVSSLATSHEKKIALILLTYRNESNDSQIISKKTGISARDIIGYLFQLHIKVK